MQEELNELTASTVKSVDTVKLEQKVKAMYKDVALNPHGTYHFEMGYEMALRLGYTKAELGRIPRQSIDSFAGVGYHFGLAEIKEGDTILDLGSGSGMDLFIAATKVGKAGHATGIDMTPEQLEHAETLAAENNFTNVTFTKGYIESLPFRDEEFDVVISNGVINLSADKAKVFSEISRVLKRGGRMAISDIVTEIQLPENITCDATLWAACIGGALQEDNFQQQLAKAGLKSIRTIHNPQYRFLSKSAEGATRKYGVKSISVRADKI